ncbi:MAG: SurA N-terminal domain-containing protein [Gammaproteobacteria bacterium]|nr:SurA N-terminal domain-containing protein [Gammaproteobacteria bacterium]MCP5426244.1 SurA N-terminal domain-containing protein [Gammaproteobacteria bacterium]
MLQTIRDRASGWVAYTIIGLLIIPFALWGINSYFDGSGVLNVAQVGDIEISQQEFQRAYQQQRQRLQAMFGGNIDPALLDENRMKQEVLQQLVDEKVLLQVSKDAGLRVSDQYLRQAIVGTSAFQRDGTFDAELYKRLLGAQGYSELSFEEGLRNSLATEQLRGGVADSALVTAKELDQVIGLLTEQRNLRYVVLPFAPYLEKASVEDSAIEAYFKENQKRFMEPERVRVSYLDLSAERLAESIKVSDEDLRSFYQEQIAQYSLPEQRSASHILVTIPADHKPGDVDKAKAQAQEIYTTINSGNKTFQQALDELKAAKPSGIEVGDLGTITKGMLDPAFETALYALKTVGDVSEPIQTPFGFHIIRLDGITPEKTKSFDEVREDVTKQYRARQAETRFYDLAQTLTDLSYEHPDSLEPAAQALGLKIEESPWFNRQGGEGVLAYPKVVTAAFSEDVLKRGQNSEPLEVEPNHVLVIRLAEHQDAQPRSLDAVRDDIVKQLRTQQAQQKIAETANTLREKAIAGGDLQALAGEFGGELKTAEAVTRTGSKLDSAIVREAFRLPKPVDGKPSISVATLGNGDRSVIAVTQAQPGKVEDYPADQRQALAQQMAQQRGLSQYESLVESLRQRFDIVTHGDRL